MRPILFTVWGVPVSAYAVMLLLAFVVAWAIRRVELRRLGHQRWPGYHWVPAGALLGAVIGAKLGMVLFEPWDAVWEIWRRVGTLDFTGKTVVGGLIGGYIGVEIAKKAVGITRSTGDAFAVAIPVAQAIGRVGCWLNGCCYGRPELPAVQLLEAGLDLGLAVLLWRRRHQPYPEGHLFRRYLVGYATIRFWVAFLRGDPSVMLGPLSAVQWLCAAVVLVFGGLIFWRERRA